MAESKAESEADIQHIPGWCYDSISNFESLRYLTPSKRILERIEQCPSDKISIILLTTGAYCPVHRMHIEMHDTARKYIESNFNARVVGSLLSASHDQYVKPKMAYSYGEKFWLDANTRIRLINLAVKNHPIVEQDLFEIKANGFIDFHQVVENRRAYFEWECRSIQFNAPLVVMLVGEDMLKCHLYPPPKGIGLALMRRKESLRFKTRWPKLDMKQQWDQKVFLIETEGELIVSSTRVRQAATENNISILKMMLHEDVAHEIIRLWVDKPSST